MIKYKPYKSDKPDKKYYIITNDNKKVYFGQAGAMDTSQCGSDRPGFGLHSITPGIECYNYKTY